VPCVARRECVALDMQALDWVFISEDYGTVGFLFGAFFSHRDLSEHSV